MIKRFYIILNFVALFGLTAQVSAMQVENDFGQSFNQLKQNIETLSIYMENTQANLNSLNIDQLEEVAKNFNNEIKSLDAIANIIFSEFRNTRISQNRRNNLQDEFDLIQGLYQSLKKTQNFEYAILIQMGLKVLESIYNLEQCIKSAKDFNETNISESISRIIEFRAELSHMKDLINRYNRLASQVRFKTLSQHFADRYQDFEHKIDKLEQNIGEFSEFDIQGSSIRQTQNRHTQPSRNNGARNYDFDTIYLTNSNGPSVSTSRSNNQPVVAPQVAQPTPVVRPIIPAASELPKPQDQKHDNQNKIGDNHPIFTIRSTFSNSPDNQPVVVPQVVQPVHTRPIIQPTPARPTIPAHELPEPQDKKQDGQSNKIADNHPIVIIRPNFSNGPDRQPVTPQVIRPLPARPTAPAASQLPQVAQENPDDQDYISANDKFKAAEAENKQTQNDLARAMQRAFEEKERGNEINFYTKPLTLTGSWAEEPNEPDLDQNKITSSSPDKGKGKEKVEEDTQNSQIKSDTDQTTSGKQSNEKAV